MDGPTTTSALRRPALITGAGSGIGRATAYRLASEGHAVALMDVDQAGLDATVEQVVAEGGTAARWVGDVTDRATIDRVIAQTIDRFDDLGVLVNNAGIGVRAPVTDTTDEQWDAVMSVNVTGPFLTCRAVLPHLLASGGGNIVNVSSVAAVIGVRDRAVYCTSKAALLGLTRSIAADYAHLGVRVNAICPGTVDTEWIGKILADAPDPIAMRSAMQARQLDGRMGSPEDVAAGIAFLIGDDSRFVNGSTFVMDGGMSTV